MRKRYISLLVIAILVAAGLVFSRHAAAPVRKTPAVAATEHKAAVSFDKKQYSLTDPASLWIIVNKKHPLQPQNYTPTDLVVPNVPLRVPGNDSMQIRSEVGPAMEAMFAAAKTAGVPLMLSSGYRSYTYQVNLYGTYVTTQGKSAADTFSARPGYSEHQTGLAFDVEPLNGQCDVNQCFADTPAGKWVAAHAYEYGFLMRYPADKVAVTGYEYEPWHFRYIGRPLALELHNHKMETMEEYFGVTGGDYAS